MLAAKLCGSSGFKKNCLLDECFNMIYRQFWLNFICIILILMLEFVRGETRKISRKKSVVWGPGLDAKAVLPARYFFIQAVDRKGVK